MPVTRRGRKHTPELMEQVFHVRFTLKVAERVWTQTGDVQRNMELSEEEFAAHLDGMLVSNAPHYTEDDDTGDEVEYTFDPTSDFIVSKGVSPAETT